MKSINIVTVLSKWFSLKHLTGSDAIGMPRLTTESSLTLTLYNHFLRWRVLSGGDDEDADNLEKQLTHSPRYLQSLGHYQLGTAVVFPRISVSSGSRLISLDLSLLRLLSKVSPGACRGKESTHFG